MRSLLLLLMLICGACVPDPGELGPADALAAFLSAVERSTHAPDQQKLAFEWIDLRSQAALKERAALAGSLGGRTLQPWDMLVPGRLSFAAQPVSSMVLRAHANGDRATVEIPVENGKNLEVPMAREAGRWRVVLGLKANAAAD